MTTTIFKIALPLPLRGTFDYLPPPNYHNETPVPGVRVRVPFGPRELIGILTVVTDKPSVNTSKLRAAVAILDTLPVIKEDLFKLLGWCASYYQHPIGEVYHTALPSLLFNGKVATLDPETLYHLSIEGHKIDLVTLKRAPRQAEIVKLLMQHDDGIGIQALKTLNLWGPALKTLVNKGWVLTSEQHPKAQNKITNLIAEAPLPLNDAQKIAVDTIDAALSAYHTFLLYGVTGSGKTEVYMQIVEQVLNAGRSVLVLAPEIGLTPQIASRFKHRFNVPLITLHSNLTKNLRLQGWVKGNAEGPVIVIGTRSAVFTPFADLGLIVVDEEHDLSYKQQDSLRYSARDVAIKRAHELNIPIILGSATPSLESLHNAQMKRYTRLDLSHRAGEAAPPQLQLLDIRSRPLQEGLSQLLIDAIKSELSDNNQVLIFINRRGFAPTLMCYECGWVANCSNCDRRYTLHHRARALRCHHCSSSQSIPSSCPECKHTELHAIGVGTERSEIALSQLFPDHPIYRIDRDSMRKRDAMQSFSHQVATGMPCIMVGTQMLAKGHHFPNVTLVAVLEADGGFFSSDFRGLERTGQLLIQVAGRAGRGLKPGRVLIQTHQPDNELLNVLVTAGYEQFSRILLEERRDTRLPPFSYSAIIRAEAISESIGMAHLEHVKRNARKIQNNSALQVHILGPLPSTMPKKAGRYRSQLILEAASRTELHNLLTELCPAIDSLPTTRKVRWSIDIDPQEYI